MQAIDSEPIFNNQRTTRKRIYLQMNLQVELVIEGPTREDLSSNEEKHGGKPKTQAKEVIDGTEESIVDAYMSSNVKIKVESLKGDGGKEASLLGRACDALASILTALYTPKVLIDKVCKNCIYDKISKENLHNCPVCNADLSSQPLRKLRPDNKMRTMKVNLLGVYKRTPEERTTRKRNKQRKIEKGKRKATLELCLNELPKKITSSSRRSKSIPTKLTNSDSLQTLERSSPPLELLKQPLVRTKGKRKQYKSHRKTLTTCRRL